MMKSSQIGVSFMTHFYAPRLTQISVTPDLNLYFKQTTVRDNAFTQIAICRAYANYLAALLPKTKSKASNKK